MPKEAAAYTAFWFTERDSDTDLSIDGFGVPFRQDRNAEMTWKTRGRGLYVNKRYCSSVTVRESLSSPDVEHLSVSLCPFDLPREFPEIFITTVYKKEKANPSTATSTIFDVVQKLQSMSPEAPHYILEDFNRVTEKALKELLPIRYLHNLEGQDTRSLLWYSKGSL